MIRSCDQFFPAKKSRREPNQASSKRGDQNTEMSNLKMGLLQTTLEWHSAEEIPQLHIVEYAGESWLQSEPLLLVNTAGKLAVGYCQHEQDGNPRFEVAASGKGLGEISIWAIVQVPPLKD
jgi:hypothetical protein